MEARQEIALHPGSYKAAFNLGRLYGTMGDHGGQADAFRQAIAMNPAFAEGHLYLELAPQSEYAPLGHYVLADIYSRQGRRAESDAEAARGRALESSQRHG